MSIEAKEVSAVRRMVGNILGPVAAALALEYQDGGSAPNEIGDSRRDDVVDFCVDLALRALRRIDREVD